MASNQEQRSYSAPCPGCGAPVNFASAQASIAVCPYCRSTVAREGEVLKRIGTMAEVFEDYSPLQLGATGMAPAGPDGRRHAFTLIGRLQMRSGSSKNGQSENSLSIRRISRNISSSWDFMLSVALSQRGAMRYAAHSR